MELTTILALLAVVLLVAVIITSTSKRAPPPKPEPYKLGDVTLEALRYYNGYDWTKPALVAIKGKVYDVSNKYEIYGPGKPSNAFAGREVARALALGSSDEKDFTDDLAGLTPEQLQRLEGAIQEFAASHDVVGQVVPPLELTLEQLAGYDGHDAAKPMLLSIKGVVYDVTKGKDYYGPNGIYPFAGKEVARAFALYSTELSDCNDNLDGLSYSEKEALRDWIGKFNSKYTIVGKIVGK
ncbi:hypothetical protein HXX76_014393 [Chlamydomonas incerta]|uniref:Cytochrome b5 heme-binding domain-containing protein n=1 Tax=Chlamydomonas incerta TaxID=51695 RepID=A0A835VPL5_CHLIN|nr:hypothetical protein HXX76_014393 [Chlamydomonas incerta]|eukprot:KAG2424512.1 hypothetical protein HXX76_014393 [Chlamydomonas incerta]